MAAVLFLPAARAHLCTCALGGRPPWARWARDSLTCLPGAGCTAFLLLGAQSGAPFTSPSLPPGPEPRSPPQLPLLPYSPQPSSHQVCSPEHRSQKVQVICSSSFYFLLPRGHHVTSADETVPHWASCCHFVPVSTWQPEHKSVLSLSCRSPPPRSPMISGQIPTLTQWLEVWSGSGREDFCLIPPGQPGPSLWPTELLSVSAPCVLTAWAQVWELPHLTRWRGPHLSLAAVSPDARRS